MQRLDAQTIKPASGSKTIPCGSPSYSFTERINATSPCSCGRTMPAPTLPSAICPKREKGISTGRGGITSPILTKQSQITARGFPTYCKKTRNVNKTIFRRQQRRCLFLCGELLKKHNIKGSKHAEFKFVVEISRYSFILTRKCAGFLRI